MLRRQLVGMAFALTSIIVLSFIIPLALLIRSMAATRAIDGATAQAQSLTSAVSASSDTDIERVLNITQSKSEFPITIVLFDGTVLGDKSNVISESALATARDGRSFAARSSTGTDVYVPVVSLSGEDIRTTVIRAHISKSQLQRGVFTAYATLGVVGVSLIAISIVVGDRISKSITKPLRNASRVAQRLASGDLDARVSTKGTPEVKAVGAALNLLAERIGELLQAERERVADLSHRLRTPVTALRLAVDKIHDTAEKAEITEELNRFEYSLNAVIRQARAPITHDLGADLTTAVTGRMEFWSMLGESQNRVANLEVPEISAPVRASRHELDSMIDALVGNVFSHTPPSTPYSVTVQRQGNLIQLTVDDAGPGFPNSDVVDRGKRGPKSKGTGLGIDIARRIAERSGGSLTISKSPLGGARVEVNFGKN